ncbi:MAG TPA: DUF1499 domain-containing protein [Deltaproteobacteria bacterium]|nr:DUF1499 domain-containing protein [Deltaproteobacteria bacterium]
MATAAPILSLLAGGVALAGLGGAHFGILSPFTGFKVFAVGALLGGLASVIVALVGLYLSRGGRDPEGRRGSLVGLASGLGLLILVLAAAATGGDAPPINDITTDLENPPAFRPASVVPDYRDRDMSYPIDFVAIVREAYPDLSPLHLDTPPEEGFDRAIAAAESLGWEIVARAPSDGVFDAQDVSAVFRFVDDITVRVVPEDGGSRIDIRSKSRDGKSDLGANAARIRRFLDALREQPDGS